MNLADKILHADKVRKQLGAVASDLEAHARRAPGSLAAIAALPSPALPWFDAAPHPFAIDVRAVVGHGCKITYAAVARDLGYDYVPVSEVLAG